MRGYEFIAIGGGDAGLTAASRVAGTGRRTALVSRSPIGGMCSLNGWKPKKVLVRSAEVLDEIRRASKFGIETGDVRIDWSRVIDRKETFTGGVTDATEKSLKDEGIDFMEGSPRFVSDQEVEIDGARLRADAFVIATGSFPRPLTFEGAEHLTTSDDVLASRTIPQRVAIIGAGVIAFEFGQVFARVGAQVTVIARSRRVLARHDPELVDALLKFTTDDLGVEFVFDARVRAVRKHGEAFSVTFEADTIRTIEADCVLNASGRIPSLDGLALDSAGVEFNQRGVVVDDYLRSPSNRHVFAAGDAHGLLQLSPIASYEGRVVAKNFIESDTERVNYDAVPRVLFTVPALASVGLTEEEARSGGLQVSVTTHNLTGRSVYAILGEPIAFAKIITESSPGRIVGAHLFGRGAEENIHLFAMAMQFGINAQQIKSMVFGFPTLVSALTRMLG